MCIIFNSNKKSNQIRKIRRSFQKRINNHQLMTSQDIIDEASKFGIELNNKEAEEIFEKLSYKKISMKKLIEKISDMKLDDWHELNELSSQKMTINFQNFFVLHYPYWIKKNK